MNVDKLKSHIETTLLFAQAVAGHSEAKETPVILLEDKGNVETTLAHLAQAIYVMWQEFNLDSDGLDGND